MKIFADLYKESRDIVTAVNEFIYRHSTQEKFISMFILVLDPSTGKMTYCNAGHNAPILMNPGQEPSFLEAGGMLVGVFEDQIYIQGEATLQSGGTLAMYTDGVSEARNKEDAEYGVERLVCFLAENQDMPAPLVPQAIVTAIREHWLATDQEDDWTLLIVKRANTQTGL
jgi:sigma-B regulation protein RsbU (phosphoserine phosphatase)